MAPSPAAEPPAEEEPAPILLGVDVALTAGPATYPASPVIAVSVTPVQESQIVATGRVTAVDDQGVQIAVTDLADGAATLDLPAALLPGIHPVTVAYSGDAAFATGDAPIDVVVEKAPVDVTVVTASAVYGTAPIVQVQVSGAGRTPGGSVRIDRGSGAPTTVALTNGSASFALPSTLSPGRIPVTIEYLGDETYLGATAATSLIIERAQVSMTSKTVKSGVYGGTATVTVTLKGAGAAPTGTVSATVDGRLLKTATVRSRVATLSIPSKWAGSKRVSYKYSGDVNYVAATSTGTLASGKAKSSLSVSAARVTYGSGPKVRVSVKGAGSTPSGQVQLFRGSTKVKVGTLSRGAVTLSMSTKTAPGSYRYATKYIGSSVHLPSSKAVTVAVSRGRSSVTAASTGATVSSRARVVVTVKGAGVRPAGTVVVKRGSKVLAKGRLSAGRVTVTLPRLGLGATALSVAYSGDSRHVGSSARATVRITKSRSFRDGMHRVGVDIPAGIYRVKAPAGSLCYWARRTSTADSLAAITANDIGYDYRLVEVTSRDRHVESSGCGTWRLVVDTKNLPFRSGKIPGDGQFLVNKDVKPGKYEQYASGCYVASLTSAKGDFGDIIDNEYTDGAIGWRIDSTDKVFETSGCGTWYKVG